MSRLAENLIDIFKAINADDKLWKLLYYPKDPLNPNKAKVQTLPDFSLNISKTRIIRSPKTNDLTNDAICRLCMYFGNRSSLSRKVADQDVIFDVYVHIDTFDNNDARSLRIIDRLNELLNESTVTGIGKVTSEKMYIIGNPPSGYIGYKVVYSFGSGK
jgi:hypothetical protein